MREHEIRPRPLLDEFLRLLAEDSRRYFSQGPRVKLACPACGGEGRPAFEKNGFGYAECPACLTLYASPRPLRAAFESFYRDSASARYWASTFYKETEDARREKLWKPKARLIKETLLRHGGVSEIVDVGGGRGVFAEEIRRVADWGVVVVEPSPFLAQACRDKGLPVIEKFLEDLAPGDLSERRKGFVSFELFEHLTDPGEFLARLFGLMRGGDLFVFTTLNGLGLDIQVLWEHSKAVSPPQHLNFLNPASVRGLLERVGFEVLEVSTPGRLDLDILENDLPLVRDRFWRNYLRVASPADKAAMQEFVAARGLSSHMMAACRKN